LDTIFERDNKKVKYIPNVYCQPSKSSKKRNHSSDNDIFKKSQNIYPFVGKVPCCNNNCIKKTSVEDFMNFHDSFWNTGGFDDQIDYAEDELSQLIDSDFTEEESKKKQNLFEQNISAPCTKMRRFKLNESLRDFYHPSSGTFICTIHESATKKAREVCEAAYLIMLGLAKDNKKSSFPFIWRQSQSYIKKGLKTIEAQNAEAASQSESLKGFVTGKKTRGCNQFFDLQGDICDTIAGREGT
jgi:hypothetical protein